MDFGFVFSNAARSVLALARCMCASLAAGPSVVCSSTGSDQVQRHQTSSGFIVTAVITLAHCSLRPQTHIPTLPYPTPPCSQPPSPPPPPPPQPHHPLSSYPHPHPNPPKVLTGNRRESSSRCTHTEMPTTVGNGTCFLPN